MEVIVLLLHRREATQSVRTWHDYPWLWVSLTWLLYNLQLSRQGCSSWKFKVRFQPIRKELESSMYNNINAQYKHFYKVSQSGYEMWLTIKPPYKVGMWRLFDHPNDLILVTNSMREVWKWLKNLTRSLHLEKCGKEFESHVFHTLGLLKYLHSGSIDAFFLSPGKLLLAENTSWKAKQGDCWPRKQENTAKTSRTSSEVQQF